MEVITRNIAEEYISFLQNYKLDDNDFSELFSDYVRKIANGTIIANDIFDLKKQLDKIGSHNDSWEIYLKETIISDDSKKFVLRYIIVSKEIGAYDVLAVIKLDENKLISEIDELYYKVD